MPDAKNTIMYTLCVCTHVSAFKLPAFWDVTPYSLVGVYSYLRGSFSLPPL